MPVEVAIGGNMAALGSSQAALRAVLPMLGAPQTGHEEAAPVWEAHAAVRWPLPQSASVEESPVLGWLRNLPEGTRVVADIVRRTDELYARIALLGVTPEDVARGLAESLAVDLGHSKRTACRGNLHDIGLGIILHRNDHGMEYTATLAELFPQYVEVARSFVCPGDKEPVTIGEGIKCSYWYAGKLLPGTPPNVIVAYDKAGNHEGGRNALFGDMHVEWVAEEAFQARLNEGLRLLKQKDWDKYTPEQQKAIEAFYSGKPQAP